MTPLSKLKMPGDAIERVKDHMLLGWSFHSAHRALGVSVTTWYKWLKASPELSALNPRPGGRTVSWYNAPDKQFEQYMGPIPNKNNPKPRKNAVKPRLDWFEIDAPVKYVRPVVRPIERIEPVIELPRGAR